MSDALTQTGGSYQNVAANGDERDWDANHNRWTKGDNDRLYINDCKFVDYIALDSLIVLTNGSHVDATAEITGDTLTLEIVREDSIIHKEWTATFALPDDLAEEPEDEETTDQPDDETEIVADGGEDVTSDLSDERIEESIEKKDDPEHPEAATVAEVREALARLNSDILDWWGEHQDAIDDGGHEIVHEDHNVIVLADHSGHFWSEQLDLMEIEGPLRSILISLHHTLAQKHCDYSWSAVYPVVIQKTADFRAGEQQVLREIARRTAELGSVARAVDTLATDEHGWSKSTWASLTGRNVSTVSRMTDN